MQVATPTGRHLWKLETEMERDELWYDLRNLTGCLAICRFKYSGRVLKEQTEERDRNVSRRYAVSVLGGCLPPPFCNYFY